MIKHVAFYLGLALLLTHELDAMPNHEWRVLPLLSSLEDSLGRTVFVLAHVPIFAIVIAYIASLNTRTRTRARDIASGFFVVHAVLHFLFSGHDDYTFHSWLSLLLINGAAICGLVHIVVRWQEIRQPSP